MFLLIKQQIKQNKIKQLFVYVWGWGFNMKTSNKKCTLNAVIESDLPYLLSDICFGITNKTLHSVTTDKNAKKGQSNL